MATYFLADIHLAENRPEITAAFLDTLAALAALPCPLYYQHGNRDFLLGARYAPSAHLRILPERHTLTLGGHTVLVEHGDLLCSDDRGYQRLRRVLRCRLLQWLYYRLPRALRRRIAEKLRAQSKTRTRRKSTRITDTNPAAIRTALPCIAWMTATPCTSSATGARTAKSCATPTAHAR